MDKAIPIVVIGGVAYALSRTGGEPIPIPGGIVYPPSAGAPVNSTNAANQRDLAYGNPDPVDYANPVVGGGTTNWNNNPIAQYTADQMQQWTAKQFQDMSDVTKAKGADILNKELKLDPPLTGKESFGTVAKVVGGAAGAAAGSAICGPACGKVGAIAGAYLGDKSKSVAKKVGKAAKAIEKKTVKTVKNAAKTVGKKISGLFKSIF